jgi:hypothetical protein
MQIERFALRSRISTIIILIFNRAARERRAVLDGPETIVLGLQQSSSVPIIEQFGS